MKLGTESGQNLNPANKPRMIATKDVSETREALTVCNDFSSLAAELAAKMSGSCVWSVVKMFFVFWRRSLLLLATDT